MPNNADSICRKVSENLKSRRPALHAIHHITLWNKTARVTPLNTLTVSYTRFLPTTQLYLNSRTRIPNPTHLLLQYRSITCLYTLVGSIRNLLTLLKYSLFYYIAELYPNFKTAELCPVLTPCSGIPYLFTLLGNSQILILCCAMPNPNTLLRYTLSYYFNEQFPKTSTLLSYNHS